MENIIFWTVNVLCSIFCIWRVLTMMSWSGEVDNIGRIFVILAFVPILSVLMAISIAFAESLFHGGAWIDKWWQSPKMVLWRTMRKLRKRRRGPIVRIVEHMHNKREEKKNEADVPEV